MQDAAQSVTHGDYHAAVVQYTCGYEEYPTRLEMVQFKCVAIGVGEQLRAVHQCDIMDQRPGSPRAHFQNSYALKTAHISF